MKVLFLGFAFSVFCITASFADVPSNSDSGIYGPKYEVILNEIEKLQSDYPNLATFIDYGKSVDGRTLRMLVVKKNAQPLTPRPTLYFSGSTHGNEYLNIADRLPRKLLELSQKENSIQEFLNKGGVFVMVPVLNPDGYERRRRHNANGVDLNRDWDVEPAGHKGFKEIESRVLADQLDSLKEVHKLNYLAMVDYHCCYGALLHPWSYKKTDLKPFWLSKHELIGKIADKFLNLEVGATGQVLGYYPMGTTKDYYIIKYNALSFTYEGRYKTEKNKLDQHVQWWVEMVANVNEGKLHNRPKGSLQLFTQASVK